MNLKYIQGKKHPDDKIILIKTDGWEAPTFIDLLRLMVVHLRNEDRIYPHGQGGGMLMSALYSALNGKTVSEIKKIYKLEEK